MNNPIILADGRIKLYCGDCLEVLDGLGWPKFDAVVTDPPYGIGESGQKRLSRNKARTGRRTKNPVAMAKDYGSEDWDGRPLPHRYILAFLAFSQYQIIFGGNYYRLPPSRCWLVWDKKNGNSDFADCELAWTNLDKAVRRIEWLWNGFVRPGLEPRHHPTMKPLVVMKWAVRQLPPSALNILDPCMGSGTTGLACLAEGRSFTGIDISPRWVQVAAERIEKASRQPSLFQSGTYE